MERFNLSQGTNGNAPTVRLNSGYDMPVVGIGTYSLHGSVCVRAVEAAIQSGYRMIDTAYMYGNEREVGEAVRQSGIPRSEIFVITKLYPDQYDHAGKAIEEALKKLDIGYIDMMLLHHPASNDGKAYAAIEEAIRDGKVRSAGISCYYIKETDRFLPQVTIKPALIQNEIHPYYQDSEVIHHIQNLDIAVQSWYPLGGARLKPRSPPRQSASGNCGDSWENLAAGDSSMGSAKRCRSHPRFQQSGSHPGKYLGL